MSLGLARRISLRPVSGHAPRSPLGVLVTTVGSKYRGSKQFLLVYAKLITAAQNGQLVYYEDVASLLGINQPGYHMAREVGQVLGEISEEECRMGRPMLSAIAVASRGFPGEGFFSLATRLGKFEGRTSQEERAFWQSERGLVYSEWRGQ
ncbi:MAG: hypothetical protein AB1543_09010 [Candidatus Bipolaricaulota bacterium]